MGFKKIASFKIFFLIFLLSFSCYGFDSGDFQYWNTGSVSWELKDNWKLILEEEFRFGDDAGEFYYQHSDLGLNYSGLATWLDIGVSYRHIFEKNASEWHEENQPSFNATLKWKSFDLDLASRAKFEYRNRELGEEYWRFSDKFTVKLPLKLTRLEIQPYIAEEVLVDFDAEDVNRNRLWAGFSMNLLKGLKAEIFYLWQASKKSGEWSNLNILGTKIKFFF